MKTQIDGRSLSLKWWNKHSKEEKEKLIQEWREATDERKGWTFNMIDKSSSTVQLIYHFFNF